ncbi:MAG: hypothetical protein WCW47_02365 [Candidatus Paceibacterota bacterium]|jgi:hypothetical protein
MRMMRKEIIRNRTDIKRETTSRDIEKSDESYSGDRKTRSIVRGTQM